MANDKADPIGDELFKPLLLADRTADVLFYVSAALSIAALLVSKAATPQIYAALHIGFVLSVIGLFVTTLATRLHFFPRAQFGRLRDFLSHAYDKRLSHKQSTAYYNNDATAPQDRMAAQTLESCFFTKRILSKMAVSERARIVVYVVLWLIALLYRNTDLALIAVAAQILFSEQLLSRWLRLEWFRCETEKAYDGLYQVVQGKSKRDVAAVEWLTRYEIVKATTALPTSTKVFERHRVELNAEWEAIRKVLGI